MHAAHTHYASRPVQYTCSYSQICTYLRTRYNTVLVIAEKMSIPTYVHKSIQLTSFVLYKHVLEEGAHTTCTDGSTLTDQQSTMTEYTSLGQPGGGGRQ